MRSVPSRGCTMAGGNRRGTLARQIGRFPKFLLHLRTGAAHAAVADLLSEHLEADGATVFAHPAGLRGHRQQGPLASLQIRAKQDPDQGQKSRSAGSATIRGSYLT